MIIGPGCDTYEIQRRAPGVTPVPTIPKLSIIADVYLFGHFPGLDFPSSDLMTSYKTVWHLPVLSCCAARYTAAVDQELPLAEKVVEVNSQTKTVPIAVFGLGDACSTCSALLQRSLEVFI